MASTIAASIDCFGGMQHNNAPTVVYYMAQEGWATVFIRCQQFNYRRPEISPTIVSRRIFRGLLFKKPKTHVSSL